MERIKKIRIICIVMVLTMAVLGVVAFAGATQDAQEIAAQNVAEFDIEQIEQERDESGQLVTFKQNKKLLPAIYSDDIFPTSEDERGFWNGGIKNTLDKYVTVSNVGDSDAYFRTIIAVESDQKQLRNYLIKYNLNMEGYDWKVGVSASSNGDTDIAIIEDVYINYPACNVYGYFDILVGTYNPTLKARETSTPSLLQIAMDKNATDAEVEQFGDTFEILVWTQAVQTTAVDNAGMTITEALGGMITRDNHPWKSDATAAGFGHEAEADLTSESGENSASTTTNGADTAAELTDADNNTQ